MSEKTIFMETTRVEASRSVQEITSALVKGGARAIQTEYDGNGKITGIQFTVKTDGKLLAFKMPARLEVIRRELKKRSTSRNIQLIEERAERVAWRQLFRWVQVQMAMIDMGMAEMSEVFFAYSQPDGSPGGKTIYELAKGSGFKMLAAGPSPTEN